VLSRAKISYIPLKSSSMKDSIPTKLYESLAMGCPVLLAAAGDACDLLAECALGRSVPPENTEAIVAAFDDIAANYAQILSHREHAMTIIREKHSRQHGADLLEQELRKLCSQ
jgi:glycosyltransferase involved in cell wall biosynthesis